jgi:hypothetical protein
MGYRYLRKKRTKKRMGWWSLRRIGGKIGLDRGV